MNKMRGGKGRYQFRTAGNPVRSSTSSSRGNCPSPVESKSRFSFKKLACSSVEEGGKFAFRIFFSRFPSRLTYLAMAKMARTWKRAARAVEVKRSPTWVDLVHHPQHLGISFRE